MTPRPRLATLQVLRACAAIMVVVGHSVLELSELKGNPGYIRYFHHAFGVSVFFVISGFIMVYTASDDFGSAAGRRDFLVSRVTRIVPLYWLLTTALLLVALAAPTILHGPPVTAATLIDSYLFIPLNNAAGVPFPILAPGWSLNYEMFFYTIFVLVMFAPRRVGVPMLLAILAALMLVGYVTRPAAAPLAVWTDLTISKFVVGILIAQYRRRIARMGVRAAIALMVLGFAMFVWMNFVALEEPLWSTLDSLAAGFIVAGAVALDLRGRPFAPALLVMLGDASYSLYLVHMFVVRGVRVGWNAAHLPAEPTVFIATILLASCAVAVPLAYRFELPVHRALRRRFVGRAPVTIPLTLEDAQAASLEKAIDLPQPVGPRLDL